ncbi:hypothetical protein RHGRI_003898 [Rhododendron griersonianum]|uniref:Uncharacterized protein n=1 Tax=Rhododendron griersonianum TaxID=479676 RepID=A0AAV6L6M4_9ERIC|nr:hypothetical protein RHGRI_003898 [Rhododendron griersonianum]
MYLAKDLDEVLAKVTPGALVVDDIDLTKISKPAKKTSRSEGPSSTSSLKRKGTQEVTKLESEETPKKKKRLQKLSEKKTPTEKVAAIAGRTRSSTKTSSPDQAESKETIHHAESTPTTEVKKRKTKTAPIKETQEEKETEKVETEKSPSLVSSDSSPASLEATPEDPPVNPEHEASSQTPEKSRLSPFKPEPPTAQKDEIVEEEAEEDMEDFFKTAASLVQVSLSGISGDGSSSRLDANQNLRQQKVKELIAYAGKCCQDGVAVDIGSAAFTTSLNLLSNTVFSVDLAGLSQESAREFRDLATNITMEAGKPNLADYFPVLAKIDPQDI